MNERGLIDNFLRPVEWILYNPITSDALIVIAEEAEAVIPQLSTQSFPPKVQLLTYSAPVTKKMLPFSGLRYYSAPALPREHTIAPNLVVELGLFAGRLYMGYEECVSLVSGVMKPYHTSEAVTEAPDDDEEDEDDGEGGRQYDVQEG
ncbi:unnamed protein product [Alternaria alternata]